MIHSLHSFFFFLNVTYSFVNSFLKQNSSVYPLCENITAISILLVPLHLTSHNVLPLYIHYLCFCIIH